MEIITTSIPDVILIKPDVYSDERGFFMEIYQERKFQNLGLPTRFVQDNHSGSKKGVLRGLHYQIHQPQGKLVRALAGEVYDVAVDLRRSSTTFGVYTGVYISSANKLQVWIPPGFAHGFYVLSEWAEVLYKTTNFYAPEWDRTLLWNDPDIAIEWPLIDGQPPKLSKKDALGIPLTSADLFE